MTEQTRARILLALLLLAQTVSRSPERPRPLEVPFRQINAYDCQTGQFVLPLPLDADDRARVLEQVKKACP